MFLGRPACRILDRPDPLRGAATGTRSLQITPDGATSIVSTGVDTRETRRGEAHTYGSVSVGGHGKHNV